MAFLIRFKSEAQGITCNLLPILQADFEKEHFFGVTKRVERILIPTSRDSASIIVSIACVSFCVIENPSSPSLTSDPLPILSTSHSYVQVLACDVCFKETSKAHTGRTHAQTATAPHNLLSSSRLHSVQHRLSRRPLSNNFIVAFQSTDSNR